jgi:ABC-2 type transport system permease protein
MSALNIAEEMNIAVSDRANTATHPTRPFLWSIRRELWENPSIVVAPAAVVSVLILAILIAAVHSSGQLLLQLGNNNAAVSSLAIVPLLPVPFFLGITMVLVAIFYSLDALLSERRDRSILFWKSLPVSDTQTVLSKAAVPMVILPVATFILAIAAQIAIFVIECIALLAHHASVTAAFIGIPVFTLLGLMAYSLIVVTLWYAPIYAWFLLVSAWARRAALLWAVVPFFVLLVFERVAFHTNYVRDFMHNRIAGMFLVAFSNNYTAHRPDHALGAYSTSNPLSALWTPGHFFATPALWGGLLFAALALILIIRLRRSSDPI